jgi:hypothetical protein
MYAKATKRPWRQKSTDATPPKPGDVVLVDQMVSPVPGLITQMMGFLTMKRYKYMTVFVDQALHMSYIYLQKTATAAEMIKAK